MDEYTSRILTMLEEGKISAADAAALITARGDASQPAPQPGPQSAAQPGPTPSGTAAGAAPTPESGPGSAKSFEFAWAQKRTLPFDFGEVGRQITDAVKRVDPERIVREARDTVTRGGRQWQERLRNWSRFVDGAETAPENTSGLPVARETQTLTLDEPADTVIDVQNDWGPITLLGGAERLAIEIDKEAWAPTETEAVLRLKELRVDTSSIRTQDDEKNARFEIRVRAEDDWADGKAHVRISAPAGMTFRLATAFGAIGAETFDGTLTVATASGAVTLVNAAGSVHAETESGDLHAKSLSGETVLRSKSGGLQVESSSAVLDIASLSGDVKVRSLSGPRLNARTVSGEVEVTDAGEESGTDITAETLSGAIRLQNVRGELSLKTSSGPITAGAVTAGMVQMQTLSGKLTLRFREPFFGTLAASTVSGSVDVSVPDDCRFRYTLGTQSGTITCGLPSQDGQQTPALWTGTVGDGSGTVSVQTRSGNITLQRLDS